jgi:hypothetical protein
MALRYRNPGSRIQPRSSESRQPIRTALVRMVWLPLMILVVFLPWAWVKVLGCCAVILSLRAVSSLSRNQVAAMLGLLFAVAYLFTPYWLIPVDAKRHAMGPMFGNAAPQVIWAAMLLLLGAAWAWGSSGEVFRPAVKDSDRTGLGLAAPAVLAVFVLAISYTSLYYSMPVQGDEEWHFWRLRNLYMGLSPLFSESNLIFTIAGAAAAAAFLGLFRHPAVHIRVFIICTVAVGLALWQGFLNGKGMAYLMLRYPFASCWLQQIGPVWPQSLFDEGAYRVLPMVSVFVIGYFVIWAMRGGGTMVLPAMVAGAAAVTVPNIYYHASPLYLEMPAVALAMIALYYIERLVTDDPDMVRTCPGWYALLAAGFIKETFFAILVAVIVLRVGVRATMVIRRTEKRPLDTLIEAMIVACMAAPLGVYLFFRLFFGDVRLYNPHLANLTNPTYYVIAFEAVWSQYGLLLPLAIGGFAVAWHQGKRLLPLSLAGVFLADFLFHFMDNPTYIGMARFNLMLFAPLAVLAIQVLLWAGARWKHAIVGIAAVWMVVNIAMSPVALGGERKPYWMSRDTLSCDFYFPKAEAVSWLKEHRPGVPLAVAGAYVDTKIFWYYNKLGYSQQTAVIEAKPELPPMGNLRRAIAAAASSDIPIVLYFRMTPGTQLTDEERVVGDYLAVQEFRNKYLEIVLYEKAGRPR